MARRLPRKQRNSPRFPHPRGDGPQTLQTLNFLTEISPPAWGWPAGKRLGHKKWTDFPTRVGMARSSSSRCLQEYGFPDPRGDGPHWRTERLQSTSISPPAWGWPGYRLNSSNGNGDFPTRVGMARPLDAIGEGTSRFPHPRGDGPNRLTHFLAKSAISPPAWGWPVTRCLMRAH